MHAQLDKRIGRQVGGCLLYTSWDALPAALDSSLEEIEREGRPKKQQRKITSKDIPDIYPIGSEIMVQVTKGPIGTKGPRVTTNVSLAGRYLVLMPFTDQFGISRKIEDPKERLRLRQIMQKLNVPDGMGIIMRTVAQGQRYRHFVRDLAMLLEQWYSVEEKKEANPAPVCVYKDCLLYTSPTARTLSPLTATTEGSRRTMPWSLTLTRVLAVPRSMPMS